eukprot:3810518-Alexandrium_andersonii.AAC.1
MAPRARAHHLLDAPSETCARRVRHMRAHMTRAHTLMRTGRHSHPTCRARFQACLAQQLGMFRP